MNDKKRTAWPYENALPEARTYNALNKCKFRTNAQTKVSTGLRWATVGCNECHMTFKFQCV